MNWRLRASVIGLATIVVVVLVILQSVNLWSRYHETFSDTKSRAVDLSHILTEHMRRAVNAADSSLQQLVMHNHRIGGATAPADSWQPLLTTAKASMTFVGSLSVIDAKGVICHSTLPELIGQSRSEDFLFQSFATKETNGIIVDKPFRSLKDGRIIIAIGRRLSGPDGSFQGIVVATLIPEMFRAFYQSVDVGRLGVIWVIHPTGLVFFREPTAVEANDRQADFQPSFYPAITHSETGILTAALEPDGQTYISAWQTLDEPPIILAVSFNLPDAMRTWRRDALLSIGLVILAALALGVTTLQLVRQLDALGVAERVLIQQDQGLVEAERIAGLGSARLALPDFVAQPSPQLLALFGLPTDSRDLPLEVLLHPFIESDRERLKGALISCKTSGGRYQLEVSANLANGKERIFWTEGVLEKDNGTDTGSILAIFQDVTSQRLAEQRSSQSQRLAAVGRLTGGVAHDFNNILTAIIGHSELVLLRLPQNDPDRRSIEEISKAGHRAADLVKQLLAFSRKQVLQPKIIDLNRIVIDIEDMLGRLIGEDIELTIKLSPSLKRVKADPGQVEQILMNLTINARDAMPKGGKLIIETANIDPDEKYGENLSTVLPCAYVMLRVSDTGVGIDKEVQAHIFEPFFTTKEQGKGTGLGLSTVYGIVSQSGGNIQMHSEPGKGTTFKIYLPGIEEPSEVIPKQPPVIKSLKGSETILVVEDEEAVRKLARQTLEMSGYKVLEAVNANHALLQLGQHQGLIHLMVTDVVMPGMSGRELAQQLADQGYNMKVLFMSGYTDDSIVHHDILDQKIPFLQKPFTPDALTCKVREVLNTD